MGNDLAWRPVEPDGRPTVPWLAPNPEPEGDGHRHKPGFAAGDIIGILGGLLLLVFFGLQMQQAYAVLFGDGLGEFTIRAVDLWFNSAILFTVLGVIPWLWILSTRQGGWNGMIDYFALRRPGVTMVQGVIVGIALIVLLIIMGLIMQAAGAAQENDAIAPLQAIMTLPLALAISLSAAFGEEVLFRGILQKYLGVWPQAVVFGLLHAYQGVFGIFVTGALAVLFGYIVKYRRSLWIPIAAHFTFDIVQLSILLVAPEAIA